MVQLDRGSKLCNKIDVVLQQPSHDRQNDLRLVYLLAATGHHGCMSCLLLTLLLQGRITIYKLLDHASNLVGMARILLNYKGLLQTSLSMTLNEKHKKTLLLI